MEAKTLIRHELLARRLGNFAALNEIEIASLRQLVAGPHRTVGARQDVLREGDAPLMAFLVTSGWASRYKTLEDGRRQTLAFLIPGDLCNINDHILDELDHSIGAITQLSYLEIAHDKLESLAAAQPGLGRALWWQLLTGLSVQREWTLNLGQRSAIERISHLFCEMFLRLRAVGLTQGTTCDLPITQIDLSEATGLTSVHVNRTLQEMRARNLVRLKGRRLDIPDLERLERTALFNPTYLHLGRGDVQRMPAENAAGATRV
jgi:CRP-like cAMP-binding protein